jgi:gamma-glutamyl:cysteine ligase YbdK (ATP-grasp superfamily)
MGQSIERTRFEQRDYARFRHHLDAETSVLHDLVEGGGLSCHAPVAGLELEAWLIDASGRPSPRNAEFIARVGSPDVVTEIGRFNVELNVAPQPVQGGGLGRLAGDLLASWQRCRDVAAEMNLQVVAIGILPTVTEADLTMANVSEGARYRALNQQVLRQRHGRPTRLDIVSPHGEALHCEHDDVMLEAATTSLQVHLQVPADETVRTYNAALVASAPLVALSGNSPLLFGRRLWQETRIPLFEQALNIGAREDGSHGALARVSFGSGYAGYSLLECFRENLERFEPLLPVELGEAAGRLPHLRLHNGTIWRWNRPLAGFDDDGQIHLRIEHRPMAAGPSLPDMMANLAFSIGLIAALAGEPAPPESRLGFEHARHNFYEAARLGLAAPLRWTDGRVVPAARLLCELAERARRGLEALDVDPSLADAWISLVDARLARETTGARWQLARLDALGGNLAALTLDYARRQAEGAPVHLWR